MALIPLDDTILASSETLPPATVATLDAIHLATALRVATPGVLDTVMIYDRRLSDGTAHHVPDADHAPNAHGDRQVAAALDAAAALARRSFPT